MISDAEDHAFELLYVVVNFGMGSKVLHKAKACGITGGTVLLGRGTVSGHILKLLGITDVRKEIVMMVSDTPTAERTLEALQNEFRFEKPNHGIVFSIYACSTAGSRCISRKADQEGRGVGEAMYSMVTVIVEKGKAEQVIDAATKAGSTGGTIINARGSGIHETRKVFSMEIEPEKEVVMILAIKEKMEKIVDSIRNDLRIDDPGNGIIFIQEINRAYGLHE